MFIRDFPSGLFGSYRVPARGGAGADENWSHTTMAHTTICKSCLRLLRSIGVLSKIHKGIHNYCSTSHGAFGKGLVLLELWGWAGVHQIEGCSVLSTHPWFTRLLLAIFCGNGHFRDRHEGDFVSTKSPYIYIYIYIDLFISLLLNFLHIWRETRDSHTLFIYQKDVNQIQCVNFVRFSVTKFHSLFIVHTWSTNELINF